jgi:hypothetical protein
MTMSAISLLPRRCDVLWASVLMLGATTLAQAQQAASVPLTQGGDAVTLPGVGRIVLVFVLMAGLAVAIVALLRRVLPKFNGLPAASGNLRIVNRLSLGGGLRVHVVQYDDRTVMLAEGRHGLALTVLKNNQEVS